MAFLRGVKRCSKVYHIKNEAIREELKVFNLNEKLKDYKQRWKGRLERMSDSRLAKQVWKYKPIGLGCVGRPRLEDFLRQNLAYAVLLSLIHIYPSRCV